jgi:riboflavin transporter FmnP
MKLGTATLAKIAVLSALVVVFDYSLKFSGLKIPFPWLPFLKFDFTGIPIVLSTLIIDLGGGTITSIVAFLAILVRSGDAIGASKRKKANNIRFLHTWLYVTSCSYGSG